MFIEQSKYSVAHSSLCSQILILLCTFHHGIVYTDKGGAIMPKLLEELWYGNIYVSDQIKHHSTEVKELLRLTDKQRTGLTDVLTEEQKTLFEKYDNLLHELYALYERETFIYGFKMGARLLAEVMIEDGKG